MNAWWRRMARRVRALARAETLDRERDDEMRHHLALESEEIARLHHVDRAEAMRRAHIAFGSVSQHREAHRDARGVRWLAEGIEDVRYAARSLRRSAGFTTASVLVLALGIGATTAVYSAVNAVLVDPDYEGLSVIIRRFTPSTFGTLSTIEYRAIEEEQRSFADVGALRWGESGFSAGSEPERVRFGAATSGIFRALRVKVSHGRGLTPDDERIGAAPVVILSQSRAVRSFGSESAAIGRSVLIDGITHEVVGVLPAGVRELAGIRADVWPALQLKLATRLGPFGLRVIARVRDGVTNATAERDLAVIHSRVMDQWSPAGQKGSVHLESMPLRVEVAGDASRMLTIFAAAVGFVLLIAIANVASLMLVRAIGRSREVALRTVLGATRTRLVRLLVTESLVLALIGAISGTALGGVGLRALVTMGPRMPHLESAKLDLRAVGFAALVALIAGAIVGAYPVAQLLRRGSVGSFEGGDRTIGAGRRTHALRSAFVVLQFALALPLLAAAGLLLNSFVHLQRVDPGFDPARVLTASVSLPGGRYPADTLVARYWARALPALRQLPGVEEVALGSSMPPNDNGNSLNNFDLIDHPVGPGVMQPMSPWPTVSASYFAALGLRLLDGRMFVPADTGGPAPVLIVSRSWAKRFFPEGNVVGRTLISGGCIECPRSTVIGVVGDVPYAGLQGAPEAIYGPVTENWQRDLNIFVRTSLPPRSLAASLRTALQSVDPAVPLDDVLPMEERLYASIAQPRHWTALLGGFAAAALLLSAIGIFGMLSYTVNTRRREIGVRMALGARRNEVVAMVVRRGLWHAVVGTMLGLVAALVGTRWLASSLFGISATDPATLASVTTLLLVVATIACWLPARRAAAIDPVDAIRVE